MMSAARYVIATACAAGFLVAAAASASANPYAVTDEEIAWGDEYGQEMVCEVFAASPDTDGLVEVVSSVMAEGWDQQSAGRVVGYSLGAYCPDLLGQWAKAVDEL